MAHVSCIDHDVISKCKLVMTILIFAKSRKFQYFNQEKYFFWDCTLKTNFYFIDLLSSYKMSRRSNDIEVPIWTYDFFSEYSPNLYLFKNLLENYFFCSKYANFYTYTIVFISDESIGVIFKF